MILLYTYLSFLSILCLFTPRLSLYTYPVDMCERRKDHQ